MNKKWYLAPLLLLALFAGLFFYNKYRVAPSINFSKLKFFDDKGNTVKFESYKGQKLIVCFAATWCGNCWHELNELSKIKNSSLSDVTIIVISDESPDKFERFENKFGNNFTYLRLDVAFPTIGIHSIPVTYILNKDLKIKKESVGYIDWKDFSTLQHLKTLMN